MPLRIIRLRPQRNLILHIELALSIKLRRALALLKRLLVGLLPLLLLRDRLPLRLEVLERAALVGVRDLRVLQLLPRVLHRDVRLLRR